MTTATNQIKIKDLELPEVGSTVEYWDQDGRFVSVEVAHDTSPLNPMDDWDGQGTIHSFSRRHANFLDLSAGSVEDARGRLTDMFGEEGVGWLQLGYYEHGQCAWFPIDGPIPVGVEFRWDGRRFAGVWVPDDVVMANVGDLEGDDLRRRLVEYCGGVCSAYNAWCNGEVYGYVVRVREKGEELVEESCWGFYLSNEDDEHHLKSCVQGALKSFGVVELERA